MYASSQPRAPARPDDLRLIFKKKRERKKKQSESLSEICERRARFLSSIRLQTRASLASVNRPFP